MFTTTKDKIILTIKVLNQISGCFLIEVSCRQVFAVKVKQELIHPPKGQCGIHGKHRTIDMSH